MRRIWISLVALATLTAAGTAAAQSDRGWYGGVSLGRSSVNFDDDFLAISGATASTLSKDDTDSGVKLFAGYRLQRNFALEGGFTDFGSFSAERRITAPATGTASASVKSSGFHLDAVGILPIGNFDLLAKLGLIYTTTKTDLSSTGAVVLTADRSAKKSELNPKLGVGVEYHFSRALSLRSEYEQAFSVGDANSTGEGDIQMLSVGLIFRF
jgi:OmpA-OmpF porin, OOP family